MLRATAHFVCAKLFPPRFRLRSKRGKLLPDTSSRMRCPGRNTLLVAPSDPEGANYPKEPTGFSPVPRLRLPFPSIVVTSDDDPYVSLDRARVLALALMGGRTTAHACARSFVSRALVMRSRRPRRKSISECQPLPNRVERWGHIRQRASRV